MGNQKLIYAVLGVVVIGLVGFLVLSNNKQAPTQSQNTANEEKSEVKSATTQDPKIGNDFSSRFISYSDENLKNASENGRAIVFLHAGWCPMCKQAEADLKTNFDQVPQDVTILKTDYDTSSALKAKYGITMQDSWVQVDKDGNKVVLWNSGGEGLKTLLASLK